MNNEAGKGDTYRSVDWQRWDEGWDKAFGGPRLSILIPTIPCREPLLQRLLAVLTPQLTSVEVLTDPDEHLTTGAKRNRLMDRSSGLYVCHVDDDDLVSPDYVQRIFEALGTSPDCVGFRQARYLDGQYIGEASYSMKNTRWASRSVGGVKEFSRWPCHLTPIRREIATKVRFPEISDGEDVQYAYTIRQRIKTEVFIDAVLYHYFKRREQK